MRTLILMAVLPVLFFSFPGRAAESTAPHAPEAQDETAQSKRADRPQREAVKLSPHARKSAPRPDESGVMKKEAPPPAESPLQNVPALMEPPPVVNAPATSR